MRSTFAGDLGLAPAMRSDGRVVYREPATRPVLVAAAGDVEINTYVGGLTYCDFEFDGRLGVACVT